MTTGSGGARREPPLFRAVQSPATPEFDKYERFGAYHWREMSGLRHAVMACRYSFVLRHLDPQAVRILDVGCGDAFLTHQIRQTGRDVVGLDTSHLGLQLGIAALNREAGGASSAALMRGDLFRLPVRDECFDSVVMADVIEHVAGADEAVAEAWRVLRPGGQLLITTPRRRGETFVDKYHVQEYTGPELRELLRRRYSRVQVGAFALEPLMRLWNKRVLGRGVFRFALNVCTTLVGNPFLLGSGNASSEDNYTQLWASAWK